MSLIPLTLSQIPAPMTLMPSLAPLLTASPLIQLHVAAALVAIALAPVNLMRRRRDRLHRWLGRVWVLAMALTAASSFGIQTIRMVGGFSPIHLLSTMVLVNMIWSVVEVRRGNVVRHARIMKGTAFWGLGVAGLFTLLPGRLMNEVVFPATPLGGFILAALIASLLIFKGFRRRPGAVAA